ncbi:5729_t:CDS:2 [Funneliformis caledonium]|uniref:5729_t:CDS:1 n=1 Tax=Funneliformis caledonium TaxID=1117310 RepID=A0A9N9GXB5_9GLOM|nr:5729_t:CDS:2 [Funneliformis caledonium]
MSPSRQQTIRNEPTKETYDSMDIDEPQKNLPTSRSSTAYSTNTSSSRMTTSTIPSQEQKRQEQQQQLDKEAFSTVSKVDPEVVWAAAQLFILSNQARNNYLVDSNSNVVDVSAANRSSAMSLSNLLLPDEANSSSKATNDAPSLREDGVHNRLREGFVNYGIGV